MLKLHEIQKHHHHHSWLVPGLEKRLRLLRFSVGTSGQPEVIISSCIIRSSTGWKTVYCKLGVEDEFCRRIRWRSELIVIYINGRWIHRSKNEQPRVKETNHGSKQMYRTMLSFTALQLPCRLHLKHVMGWWCGPSPQMNYGNGNCWGI